MQTRRSVSSHRHNISNYHGKAIFAAAGCAFLLFVFTLSLCQPGVARAQISQLSDENLSGISGQAGVSINMDLSVQVHYDFLNFSDTQTNKNWIELHDFNVNNGLTPSGSFFVATRYYDEPVDLVTSFVTYYSTLGPHYDAAKAAYTWADNEFAILTDAKVQDGTIVGLEEGMKRLLYPITYDIATDSGRTFVSILDSSAMSPRTYSVGSLVINAYDIKNYSAPLATAVTNYITSHGGVPPGGLSAAYFANPADPSLWDLNDFLILDALNDSIIDPLIVKYQASVNHTNTSQSLGSIKLEALRQGPSLLHYWAHAGQGISFDYATAISANALTYTYNTTPKTLSLTGINIAGSATGAPQTPSSWAFSGDFKIGSIGDSSNLPATIDVATDGSNKTSLFLSQPMSGTFRVADVNFGSVLPGTPGDFGPIAIDGIKVHSLNVKITP